MSPSYLRRGIDRALSTSMLDHTIDPKTTIAALVETYPTLRPVLSARGIDLCCSGGLTLDEAAQARGIPITDLLNVLANALKEAPPPRPIGVADTIRNILARYPATVTVFERHGLMGCGGTAGPDERIDLFAAIHRIDVQTLLEALNDAVARGPEPSIGQSSETAPLYPPFIRAALISTLTLGATFGAANLLWVHGSLGPIPSNHHWIHGGVQVWGFVFLFIAGVAYHVLPRFLGTNLAMEKLARTTLWMGLAGLGAMTWGRLGAHAPFTLAATVVGATLELVTVACFAAILAATRRRGLSAGDPFLKFLSAGTLGWLVAACLLVTGALDAAIHQDADIAAGWNDAVYAAALFGGTLAWIEGIFLRVGPVFLGLAEPRTGLIRLALGLGATGAVLTTAGAALAGHSLAHTLTDLGLMALAGNAFAYVTGIRPFSGRSDDPGAMDAELAPIVRLSLGGLVLFALLGSTFALMDLAGQTPHRLIFDGARHAFTLGFVTLMIVGMAGRIVPIFGGTPLRWPALRSHGAHLIALGVVLREAQVLVGLGGPGWLMWVSGVSGVIAATGVTMASASILGTLAIRPGAIPIHARRRDGEKVAMDADTNVGRLVEDHPDALPILIEAGFTPLANPFLRHTLAHAVTLRQACRMHGIDVEAVLAKLRRAGAPPAVQPIVSTSKTPDSNTPASSTMWSPRAAQAGTTVDEADVVAPPLWSFTAPRDAATLRRVLESVVDPELGVNIVDLGLVYDLTVSPGGAVQVRMTLTTPGCPHSASMAQQVYSILSALPGIGPVEVSVVLDPPWTPEMMSQAARGKLGLAPTTRAVLD